MDNFLPLPGIYENLWIMGQKANNGSGAIDFLPSTVTFNETTPACSTSQQAPLANCTSTEPPLWLPWLVTRKILEAFAMPPVDFGFCLRNIIFFIHQTEISILQYTEYYHNNYVNYVIIIHHQGGLFTWWASNLPIHHLWLWVFPHDVTGV